MMSCKFVCGKRQFLNTFIKLGCIRGIRNSFTRPHVHLYLCTCIRGQHARNGKQAAASARALSILDFLVCDSVWTVNDSEIGPSLWTTQIGSWKVPGLISRLLCPLCPLGGQITLRTFAPINLDRSQVVSPPPEGTLSSLCLP